MSYTFPTAFLAILSVGWGGWTSCRLVVKEVTNSLGFILIKTNGDSSDQTMEQTVLAEASSVMVEAALHKESKADAHVLSLVTLRIELTSQRSYTSVKGTKKNFVT